ncbi:MAG: hypothetical protein V3U73_09885, partial [bacterium]
MFRTIKQDRTIFRRIIFSDHPAPTMLMTWRRSERPFFDIARHSDAPFPAFCLTVDFLGLRR